MHPDYQGGAPFISPEGSYLIFTSGSLPGSFGKGDLYIGFKKKDGSWTAPVNMGPEVNSELQEHLSIVTGDGKYLFIRTEREGIEGIYWLRADIISELRQKAGMSGN